MAGSGKLSRNQEKAIAALLNHSSIPEAAKSIGIGERTLFRWLKLDPFKSAYREARQEVVSQAIARIQAGMARAVTTLKAVMKNEDAPASARVSAAKAMLDMGLKVVEIENLEARIDEIEKVVKGKK